MIKEGNIEVLGSNMHYMEAGTGKPILFLHGVPTSSYLWRDVIPHLTTLGRCIAPDMMGFGQSDKPDIAYTVRDHLNYLTHFIDALNLKDIVIVMHGVGSVMGLHYALNHEDNCRGLVFYEAFLRPMQGDNVSLPFQEQANELREAFHDYDVSQNGVNFIDLMISQAAMNMPVESVMQCYRQPFMSAGSAQPIIQYINDAPHGTGKSEIDTLLQNDTEKLMTSTLPKLLLYSIPGFITTMATIMWAKKNLTNLELMDVGEEFHLAQESNPTIIGESISIWLQGIEQLAQESR